MNYEEKTAEYRRWLVDQIRVTREDFSDCVDQDLEVEGSVNAGAMTAYDISVMKFDEIFGASERSGVGENEDQEQLIDLLKDALFSYQQYGELSDEVVERIEKSIHA